MSNHRSYVRKSTREQIESRAEKNETGTYIDPNTKEPITGKPHNGHVTGMENRGFLEYSDQAGMSQKELNNTTNNAGLYQLEDGKSNSGHKYEEQDANQTALNTANFCYLENPEYKKNTYINPPTKEGEPWNLSVKNKNTGEESLVGTFEPHLSQSSNWTQNNNLDDFGSINATTETVSQSNTQTQGNSLDDFGSINATTENVSQSNTKTQSNSLDDFGASHSIGADNNMDFSGNNHDSADSNENSL